VRIAEVSRRLWGLIAVKLGGWKAYETIKASDEARTNSGSEAMIAILKQAVPCLVLLDEVVAYAVPGVLVLGTLPVSRSENLEDSEDSQKKMPHRGSMGGQNESCIDRGRRFSHGPVSRARGARAPP